MRDIFKSYLTLLSVAMLGGVLTLGGYKLFVEETPASPATEIGFVENRVPMNVKTVSNLGSQPSFTAAAAAATPTVVHIKSNIIVQSQRRSLFSDPFFDDFFFGQPRSRQAQASGSGVITSPDGYIVTNNHVVENATAIEVVLYDGRSYQAQLVGTDPSTDLALLKIEQDDLPYLPFGNSDNVQVGEWVLAVGNPFNLSSTVTAGIVSAKARNINILKGQTAIESFIQTDAAVNPGNSGGALVNSRGELIGINTAIASPTGAYSGYSFAVPAEIVKKVVKDLMVHGVVQRAYLGADMVELNADVARKLGIEQNQGVYIQDIVANGSAARAGIEPGDVIVAVDGKELRNGAEFQEYIGRKRPGDAVTATISRNGRTKKLAIELQNYMGTTDLVEKQTSNSLELLGVELEELSSREMDRLRIDGGVRIIDVKDGKIRQSTDIRRGFIITGIDNQPVKSAADLERILANKNGGVMLEGIYPDRPGLYYYAFGV